MYTCIVFPVRIRKDKPSSKRKFVSLKFYQTPFIHCPVSVARESVTPLLCSEASASSIMVVSRIVQLLGLCLWLLYTHSKSEDATVKGTVIISGKSVIGNIDDDFVCATLDWWPPQKCDYGRCSWGLASLLNLVFLLTLLSKLCFESLKWFSASLCCKPSQQNN